MSVAVDRKNLLLCLTLHSIDSDRQIEFYVVLNTVLAEKRLFTYRMFLRVFS
jgi:hypothetical protein